MAGVFRLDRAGLILFVLASCKGRRSGVRFCAQVHRVVIDAVDGNGRFSEQIHPPVVHSAKEAAAEDVAQRGWDDAYFSVDQHKVRDMRKRDWASQTHLSKYTTPQSRQEYEARCPWE